MELFDSAIAERGRETVARIDTEVQALSGLIETKLSAIEDTIVNRGGELDERIGKRHEDLAALFASGPRYGRLALQRTAASALRLRWRASPRRSTTVSPRGAA